MTGADLPAASRWVKHWDRQMTAQTARRAAMPTHYSTGALDPHIAVVRQYVERRRWTFRTQARMNLLLGVIRLHINRLDNPTKWASLLHQQLTADGTKPSSSELYDPVTVLPDGSRACTLRKHPVPPQPRE